MKAHNILTTQPPGEHGSSRQTLAARLDGLRTRSVAEMLAVVKPPSMKPVSHLHSGLWKTGWLPQPERAAS